jgi:hypothetical protein
VTAKIHDLPTYWRVDSPPRKVPALLTGSLAAEHPARAPAAVVVVVNGRIAGASKVYAEDDQRYRFALMVDPTFLEAGANSMRLFSVEDRAGKRRLRRIAIEDG